MKYAIAAMLILASAAFPQASAKVDVAKIGDLVLTYDPSIWRFQSDGGRMALEQLEDRDGDLGMAIAVTDAGPETCSRQAMLDRSIEMSHLESDRETLTLARDGFDLHIAKVQLGCRNWTGSPVYACAAYRGRVYTFIADPGGCNTPPLYDEPVMEILSGLRKS